MQIWTKKQNDAPWEQQRGAVQALELLSEFPALLLLFYVNKPDLDAPQLGAAIRVALKVGFGLEQLIITTTHPSLSWIQPLSALGIKELVLCADFETTEPSKGRTISLSELEQYLCSHLHTRTSNQTTLSVCGAGKDRIVLCAYHIRCWCLQLGQDCPHISRVSKETNNER